MTNITDTRSNQEKFQELTQLAAQEMERLKIPGIAIGLLVNGEEYTVGLGITSISNPLPVTTTTLFQIGSTTKTITATVIMRLVEQGKLSLDDRVRKYLPDFKVQDEDAAANVTILQLLNHTAGWVGDIFTDTGDGDDALQKYVEKMADVAQVSPLGEVYNYNNASFNIAGRVIEVVTGQTFEAAVRELVLEPLGMSNSFFFPAEVMLRRFVVGHNRKGDDVIIAQPWEMIRANKPAGGLISDVHDQLKYARFHMGDGTNAKGERILSAESLKLMQTSSFPPGGEGHIGLAWHIGEAYGLQLVSHGGSTVGQQSAFWMGHTAEGTERVAMTVLTNQDGGTVLHDLLSKWVFEHYLGVVEIIPEPLSLSDAELAPYTGDYVLSPTGDIFTFVAKDGCMVMTHTIGDYSSVFDTPPDPYPPMRAAIYETDHYILLDEPFKDMKGEFKRDSDDKVSGVSIGGRVLAKVKS